MSHWVLDWLRAFALTVAIEEIVALGLLWRFGRWFENHEGDQGHPAQNDGKHHQRPVRFAAVVVLVNLATHPLVWFAFPGLTLPYFWRMFWAEIWALTAESGAYWVVMPQLGPKRACLVALLANGASFAVGLLLS